MKKHNITDDQLLLVLLFVTIFSNGFTFKKNSLRDKQDNLILFIILATLYLSDLLGLLR